MQSFRSWVRKVQVVGALLQGWLGVQGRLHGTRGTPGSPGPAGCPKSYCQSSKVNIFTIPKKKRCLTSWDAGPQGPAWEKLGPFQAGAGSSSAVSPSLDLNLQQVFLRFGNIGMDICVGSCFCTNSTQSGRLDLDQLLAIKQFLDEFFYFIHVRQFSVFW